MIFQQQFVQDLNLQRTTDESGKRCYLTPNGPMESVTTYLHRTIINPKLEAWKKSTGPKRASDIAGKAATRGRFLHTFVEHYFNNDPLDLSDTPNTKSLFLKIKPHLDRCNNHRLMEKAIYSDELQLAGTPDYIGDFDTELSVVDLKTNSYAQKTMLDLIPYFLQTASYAVMYNERYGQLPTKAVIIIASPNAPQGILKTHRMDECIKMLHRFRADPIKFQEELFTIKK